MYPNGIDAARDYIDERFYKGRTMAKETEIISNSEQLEHLRLQTEFNDLNKKHQKIRNEANKFCDVIETNSAIYDEKMMGCYYRICNFLGR